MLRKTAPPSARLTIGEAALVLDVSVNTLRRWDAAGHLKADRDARTGRRCYSRGDVVALQKLIEQGKVA